MDDRISTIQHLCLIIIQIISSHVLLPGSIFAGDENVTKSIQLTAANALITILSSSTATDTADETSFRYLISSSLFNRLLENVLSDQLLPSSSTEKQDQVIRIRMLFMSTVVRILSRDKAAVLKESSYDLLISAIIKVLGLYDDGSAPSLESFEDASHCSQVLCSSSQVLIAKR